MDTATPIAAQGIVIRAVAPEDAPALVTFYAELSAESRRSRFLGCSVGIGDDLARCLCDTGHKVREGFVAVADGRIVGHLCLEPAADGSEELAVAVADDWQRRGIGRALFARGLAWARGHGMRRIIATAYAWNAPVLRLLTSAPEGTAVRPGSAGVVSVEIPLPAGTERVAPAA